MIVSEKKILDQQSIEDWLKLFTIVVEEQGLFTRYGEFYQKIEQIYKKGWISKSSLYIFTHVFLLKYHHA